MLYLASNSPRRKELLGGLGIPFETHIIKSIDESYPDTLPAKDVAGHIAQKKAAAYKTFVNESTDKDVCVVTADTVVIVNNDILGKPADADDAKAMLRTLSGKTHQVTTGVCILTKEVERCFSVTTDVTFKVLSDEEIEYYVCHYKPLDKAGAYGIQEWIGYVGVTNLNGSYFNVMGLPVQRLYEELRKIGMTFCQ